MMETTVMDRDTFIVKVLALRPGETLVYATGPVAAVAAMPISATVSLAHERRVGFPMQKRGACLSSETTEERNRIYLWDWIFVRASPAAPAWLFPAADTKTPAGRDEDARKREAWEQAVHAARSRLAATRRRRAQAGRNPDPRDLENYTGAEGYRDDDQD